VRIIFASLILIFNYDRDRSAGAFAFKYSGKNFKRIVFLALRSDFGLAGLSAIQLRLDKIFIDCSVLPDSHQ
jgi:hypothetical protein